MWQKAWEWLKGLFTGHVKLLKENADSARELAKLAAENSELRMQHIPQQERITELEAEVRALNGRLADAQKGPVLVSRSDGLRWANDPTADNQGPFCPKCHIDKQTQQNMVARNGTWFCVVCHTSGGKSDGRTVADDPFRRINHGL
jgi:predicted CXXCH cytochrome family protein